MNIYESMMEPRSDFINGPALLLQLCFGIFAEFLYLDLDGFRRYADVFFCLSKLPGPIPRVAKHALVERRDEFSGQQISPFAREGPFLAPEYITQLPTVQLALVGNVIRNQTGGFIRVERARAGRILELYSHSFLGFPASNF